MKMDNVFAPMPNQTLGIMQPMNPAQYDLNPINDPLIPSDMFDPVVNMQPYGVSPQIGGVGSVQDALLVLNLTDMLFG
jgi:hypothetical protein